MVTSVVNVVDKNLIDVVETVFDFGQNINKRNMMILLHLLHM